MTEASTTQRPCVTCGQTITITTRNPNRRFCSPRCRAADWHTRHDRQAPTPNGVPNDVPHPRNDVPNAVNAVPAAGNAVHATNGVQRCPHCHHELAVIAVVIPADAAHVPAPEVTAMHP